MSISSKELRSKNAMATTPSWILDTDRKDADLSDLSSVSSCTYTCPTSPAAAVPPLLYHYVMDGSHDLAIERCLTHPHEAQYRNHATEYFTDLYGHTALHHVCLHGDDTLSDLILALIEAWPRGAGVPNSFGTTPLNHAVCHDAGYDVVEAMLKANVDMVNSNSNQGLLVDFALFHQLRIDRLVACGTTYRKPPGSSLSIACPASPVHYYEETLRIFKLLVRAMSHRSVTEADDDVVHRDNPTSNCVGKRKKFRLFHSCLALRDCPLSLLRLALTEAQRSNQVQEVDENGDLPLHIAVRNTSFATKAKGVVSQNTNKATASSSASEAPCSIFPYLIDADPSAARVPDNKTGRLPLSTAILYNQDWEWCVGPVLNAAPDVLLTTPREETLYPISIAVAGHGEQHWPSGVSTLHGVLTECPEIVQLVSLRSGGSSGEEKEGHHQYRCGGGTGGRPTQATKGVGTQVATKVGRSCASLARKTRSMTKKKVYKNMTKYSAK